jgi:hypothetical protein
VDPSASLGLKFTRFFSLLPGTESYVERELLAKKISPATYFRAFPKARRESAFEESYDSGWKLKEGAE